MCIILCIDLDLQVPGTQQEFQMHRNQACSHQPAGTYICCFWRSWWSWTGIKHFSGKEILSTTLDTNHQPSRAASSTLLTGNVWSQKRPARHWHYPCSDSGGIISCWLLLKDLIQSEPFFCIYNIDVYQYHHQVISKFHSDYCFYYHFLSK